MGGYERQPVPFGLNGIPRDFKYQLLPEDWERFTPLMENAIRRVPVMERVEVKKLLNGPEGFTPDGEYLLGPTSVKGFWVACAFCAHGLAGAGGIGKVMAEWIVEGHPEWDMWRLDVRRFGSNYNSLGLRRAHDRDLHPVLRHPLSRRGAPLRRNLRLSHLLPPARPGLFVRRKFGWERPNWFQPYEEKRLTVTNRWAGRITTGRGPSATNICRPVPPLVCSTRPHSTRSKCADRGRRLPQPRLRQ